MSWFQIKLSVPEELNEAVSNRLFELGAQGVSENGASLEAYYTDQQRESVVQDLQTYFASLKDLHPQISDIQLEVEELQNYDWQNEYKKYYVAQPLSKQFFLIPAWDEKTSVPEGMKVISMEPGQAFGTGLHPSTRLSMQLLEELSPSAKKLIDVGTGSGILAIAAQKLGVSQVEAIDNDPIAVETANENFVRNGCETLKATIQPFEAFQGEYDIVLANILLETHRELRSHYARLLAPQGRLIVAGLLISQGELLDSLFADVGLVREEERVEQEWSAYVYRHQIH